MNKQRKKVKIDWHQYGVLIVLIVLFAVMSLASDAFLTPKNLMNLIRQVAVIGVIAIGTTFVCLTGGIDISVGSVAALAGVVSAMCASPNGPLNWTDPTAAGTAWPFITCIIAAVLIGAICGFINGFFIAKIHMPPMIVTLAMMSIARGIALLITKGSPVHYLTNTYKAVAGSNMGIFPLLGVYYIVALAIAYLILNRSVFGRHIFAVGGNETAAQNAGINVVKTKIIVYTGAGIMAGLGGLLLASRLGSGAPTAAEGYEMDAIAAAVVGGVSLEGGVGTVSGALIGVLIMGVLSNGFTMLNVNSYIQDVVKGAIIIAAVAYDLSGKRKSGK
jgi:inositol transport system permease protein